MKKIVYILLVCVGVGCNPAAKFSVAEAGMPTLNGLGSLHGRAVVANDGARDFMVENATITVGYRDRELGSARLLLPVEIPAGETTPIRYDFALEGFTLSSLQTLQSRLLMNPGQFTVDATVWVRWGGLRKKIEMKGVPLTRIMGIISNFAT